MPHIAAPGNDGGGFGHFFPDAGHFAQGLGQQQEGVFVQRGDLRVLRIQLAQMAHAGVVEQGARLCLAGITHRYQPFAIQRAHRHVDGMRYAMTAARFFHRTHHAGQRGNRVFLQAEGQGQQEHHFGIGRPFQRPEISRRNHQHQVAAQQGVVADHPVMHEQPLAVAKRMAVGFLRGRVGGRADMRHEQRRVDGARRLAQVAVVPGRVHAAVAERRLDVAVRRSAVPTQPKAIAIGRGGAQARMQALVDKRVLGLEQHAFHLQGTSGVSQPTTHDALLQDRLAQCRSQPQFSTSPQARAPA
ncbi:hypothetical protein D3C73_995570 [compost metagenome]